MVGATTGISGALDLTYADSSIITTGVTGGVQAGVTKQLKVTVIPVNTAAVQANGKLIIICTCCCYSWMYSSNCVHIYSSLTLLSLLQLIWMQRNVA
jgi:hypothetical protein